MSVPQPTMRRPVTAPGRMRTQNFAGPGIPRSNLEPGHEPRFAGRVDQLGSTDHEHAPATDVMTFGFTAVDFEGDRPSDCAAQLVTGIRPENDGAAIERVIDGEDERLAATDDCEAAEIVLREQLQASGSVEWLESSRPRFTGHHERSLAGSQRTSVTARSLNQTMSAIARGCGISTVRCRGERPFPSHPVLGHDARGAVAHEGRLNAVIATSVTAR